MRVKTKICGITTLEDARYCAGAGADYLGFIQHPESPRYVEPRAAKEIIAWVYGPQAVGVFVNEDVATVNRLAGEVGFDLVQLHGTEPPAYCAAVERPVIKAVAVAPGATVASLRAAIEPYLGSADFFLLDTRRAGLWGGTGETFDWALAHALAREFPIFLAGGIGAHNLEAAVRTVQPYAVDLSSSVESAPGRKDFDRLAAFFDTYDALTDA